MDPGGSLILSTWRLTPVFVNRIAFHTKIDNSNARIIWFDPMVNSSLMTFYPETVTTSLNMAASNTTAPILTWTGSFPFTNITGETFNSSFMPPVISN